MSKLFMWLVKLVEDRSSCFMVFVARGPWVSPFTTRCMYVRCSVPADVVQPLMLGHSLL